MQSSLIALKGEMNMQNILHIHTTNTHEILHAVAEKRDESPQFFLRSPIVVDCLAVMDESQDIDFSSLLLGLRSLSFVPVGIRHLDESAAVSAIENDWCILRGSQGGASQDPVSSQVVKSKSTPLVEKGSCVEVVTRPVRSGQQIFSNKGDVVVLSQTSAGSEILASGSIHVYGNTCGRILAGVNGDKTARIFSQSLNAELIAIAGCYQLLDEINTPLKGQAAMISLQGDSLLIEAMF